MVDLLMKVADFELGLEIHAIIIERAQAVLRLLPALAHHDDRRLDCGNARQDEIEQDERVGVKIHHRPGIEKYPDRYDHGKGTQECPTAAEGGKRIRGMFADRAAGLEGLFDVLRDE